MLTIFDFAVIGFFFIFFIGLGFFFRRFAHNSSEYFRGGGQMAWWLVGASSFMASFSAWTFTGGAGVAYDAGIAILVIYLANAVGFFVNAIWLAPLFRQMRVITIMEAVRTRLGVANEQFFMWINLPLQLMAGAIWLYGLAIFCSPVFGLDMVLTVVLCGCVVSFVAATGGAWAVAASDFLQALMLFPITIVIAVFCMIGVGGPSGLVDKVPAASFDLTASHVPGFGVLWVLAIVLEKIVGFNTLQVGGARYLAVRNGKEARWSAFMGAGLFTFGSVMWFIPPLTAKAMDVDLAALFPTLSVPSEGAYVAMAKQFLPTGLLGLMVTGMLAATMSSMNESLNRNAGIFVRSFYLPIIRPNASEREQVWMGRLATVIFGMLIVLIALFYSSLKGMGVFNLMLSFTAMLVMPTCVPMFWCMVTRRTPDWVAWASVLIGFASGALITFFSSLTYTVELAARLGMSEMFESVKSHSYVTLTLINIFVGSIWYLGATAVFGCRQSEKRRVEITAFFRTMNTPLSPEEQGDPAEAGAQSIRIGRMALFYAGFVSLLLLVPNPLSGRLAVLFCAGFIGCFAWLLIWTGKRKIAACMPEPDAAQIL